MKKYVLLLLFFLCIKKISAQVLFPFLYPIQKSPFFLCTHCKQDTTWYMHTDVALFCNTADTFFAHKQYNGSKKTSLATLFFGKPTFTIDESFANATVDDQTANFRSNPFIQTVVTPKLCYKNNGIISTTEIARSITNNWQVGCTISIPFHSITIKNKNTGPGSGIWGGETSGDLFLFVTDTINNETISSFAFRLDGLSSLPIVCTPEGLTFSLVSFNDTAFDPSRITIRGKDITEDQAIALNQNPVSVIKHDNIPAQPFAITFPQAQALDALSSDGCFANGALLQNNQRARFILTNNYTPLGNDKNKQKTIWIVPSVKQTPNSSLVPEAIKIHNAVKELLPCIHTSVQETFASNDIAITDQKQRGIGDLYTGLFAKHCITTNFFVRADIGLTVPTGKKSATNTLFTIPLGNNGHIALHMKTEIAHTYLLLPKNLGYSSLHFTNAYTYTTPNTERIPASFIGATIKHINPITNATLSWHEATTSISHYWHPFYNNAYDIAIGIGYQLYHKTTDHIQFKKITQNNLIGDTQQLDARIASMHTARTAHSITCDVHTYYNNIASFFDPVIHIFGGAHLTVAGKNIPKQKGWHIGCEILL